VFHGIAGYASVFIAQYHGAGNREMCSRVLWQGVYFALLAGVLYPTVILPVGDWYLQAMGHDPDILAAERTYFRVLAWGAVFPLVATAFSSFYSGRGATRTVMLVSAAAAVLNIVLNYGLIFGAWGMPEWGIYGAAVATNIGAAFSTLVYLLLISQSHWRREYGTWRFAAFRRHTFARLIRFGGPSGVSLALDIMAFTMFVLFIGRLGRIELIASNITLAINSLAFMPMLGLSIATGIVVGHHIGERRIAAAERTTYAGVKLVHIFQSNRIEPDVFADVIRHARILLALIAIMGILDALNTVFSGALKGAGDTWFCMWSNVVIAWVIFVPPLYLMVEVWRVAASYAYVWLLVYVLLLASVYTWRFRRGTWKTIEIKEHVDAADGCAELADGVAASLS
jgi:MATE family multidrug resistance protein